VSANVISSINYHSNNPYIEKSIVAKGYIFLSDGKLK
jgi:hypothetical protein